MPRTRLGGHRGGNVGEREQLAEVGEREDEHPEDAVGAVDQREALLRPEDRRLDPGRRKRLRGRPSLTARVEHLALADQRQRAVRKRREVTAGAERAVLGNDRA